MLTGHIYIPCSGFDGGIRSKGGQSEAAYDHSGDSKNPSLKVAVLNGGFEEGILKTKNIPDSQKVVVKDPTSGLETVTSGRADAFLLPELSLKNLTLPSGLEVTAKIEDAPKTGSGAAFSKKNAAFAKEYNTALEKFKKTDEFKKILDKWGFDADAARSATVEELCKVEG